MVMLAVSGFVATCGEILRHWIRWYDDEIQSLYVRILAAVPVVFVCAMGALLFPLGQPMFVCLRTRWGFC